MNTIRSLYNPYSATVHIELSQLEIRKVWAEGASMHSIKQLSMPSEATQQNNFADYQIKSSA